jgi:DNA-binding transcriptional MerR regulator
MSRDTVLNIHALAEAVGETPRQIRHLIAEGIIVGPAGSDTKPIYSQGHVTAVRRYQTLRQVLKLSEIKALFYTERIGARSTPIILAPGVLLMIDPEAVRHDLDAKAIGERAEAVIDQFNASHPSQEN